MASKKTAGIARVSSTAVMLLSVSLMAEAHAPSRAMVPNTNPEWDDARPPPRNSSLAHDGDGSGHAGPLTSRVADHLTVGYYSFSWTPGGGPPPGNTIGIAFSGSGTVSAALQAGPAAGALAGTTRYLALGGGNKHGVLSVAMLSDFVSSIPAISGAGFNGVCFDVEETHDETQMILAMEAAFASCREAGLRVMVTTSHSAPVTSSAPSAIVASWVANSNIDILSPQLYTTGKEESPMFDTSGGVAWSSWQGARAVILPSLVDGSHYASTKAFFSSQGISIGGYVQWKEG